MRIKAQVQLFQCVFDPKNPQATEGVTVIVADHNAKHDCILGRDLSYKIPSLKNQMEGMRSQINEMSHKIDKFTEISKRQSQPSRKSINLSTIPEEIETTETSHCQDTPNPVQVAEEYKLTVKEISDEEDATRNEWVNTLLTDKDFVKKLEKLKGRKYILPNIDSPNKYLNWKPIQSTTQDLIVNGAGKLIRIIDADINENKFEIISQDNPEEFDKLRTEIDKKLEQISAKNLAELIPNPNSEILHKINIINPSQEPIRQKARVVPESRKKHS